MEIILLQDVDKVGDKHEVVTVKNGYARNFLIPQGKALIYNNTNKRRLADLRNREAKATQAKLGYFQEIAKKVEGVVLKIGAKAGTSGKIFGSVTNVQLAAALKEQAGVEIERKRIILPEEVKTLGTYTAELKMHPDVKASVGFEVVAE